MLDPNRHLSMIRSYIHAWRTGEESDQGDAAASALLLFEDLDGWLSRGGFPPEAWREGPDAPEAGIECGVEERGYFCSRPPGHPESWPHVALTSDGQVRAVWRDEKPADPLGPPNPAHAELPEDLIHDPHAMESMYPRDTEDGEGIQLPSYGE